MFQIPQEVTLPVLEEKPLTWWYNKVVEPLLPGIRMAYSNGKRTTVFGNGKQISGNLNNTKICEELSYLNAVASMTFYLDGILYKDHYYLFDYLEKGKLKVPLIHRRGWLLDKVGVIPVRRYVKVMPSYVFNKGVEWQDGYPCDPCDRCIELYKDSLKRGYGGIVLKRGYSIYTVNGKNDDWLAVRGEENVGNL